MSKSIFMIIFSSLIIFSLQVEHCLETSDNACVACEDGYYLSNNECKDGYLKPVFHDCKETKDGVTCEACHIGYFFSKNHECVNTQFCQKSKKRFSSCEECEENYYLSANGLFCSSSPNCAYGDRETGVCIECEIGFYLDLNDNQCKSNQENDKFKNCKKGRENCEECTYGYFLDESNFCSLSKDCHISHENGKCLKCKDGFYLSSYNDKCTLIEDCMKVDENFKCVECDPYLLLNVSNSECTQVRVWDFNLLLNCKITDETGLRCVECKNNYFLNVKNNLCVLNIYMDRFKNCAKSDPTGEFCEVCESPYYLGSQDNLCTSTIACSYSKDGICQRCQHSFCLTGKNICIPNDKYEEDSIYYKCQMTNSINTECILCEDGYDLLNGKCFDTPNCKKHPFGRCIQCNKNYCLNKMIGCTNTNVDHCKRCDDYDHLDKCTSCDEGYRLDETQNICIKCKEGCATCSDDNNCGACENGYFAKKLETKFGAYDAECGKCAEGCKECDDENNCFKCKEGYYIFRGNDKDENLVCDKCSEGCVDCINNLECMKCDEGYYLAASGHSHYCIRVN